MMEIRRMKPFALGACLSSGLAALVAAQVPECPNMVFIIADDCSYYDLECYGAVNNRTPNIDVLAKQGMKFEKDEEPAWPWSESRQATLAEIGTEECREEERLMRCASNKQ